MEILAFTGFSCSGKSTIIKKFNHDSKWKVISFHQILKEISLEKGYKRIREWLGECGAKAITNDGCAEVVKNLNAPFIIIDGLYSKDLIEKIKSTVHLEKFAVVQVFCDKNTRIQRMSERQHIDLIQSRSDLEMIDNYKIDSGIKDIFDKTNLIVDNNRDINTALNQLNAFMDFINYHKKALAEINQRMAEEKNKFLSELIKISPKTAALSRNLIDTTDGGKRLRGLLVKLGHEMAGGKNESDAIKGALAYEIFQSSILIHDDIIDESPSRRNKPTIHYLLGNNHYGISQAICLGDVGFFWAIKILNETELESNLKFRSIQAFLDMMIHTGLGEILDVELPATGSFTTDDIESIHYLKTALYSIIGPLRLGAIMANAPESLLASIEEFGKFLGLAYQIKDDVIGVFNDEETTGKSASSDIEEKKITYLYQHALQNGSNNDLDLLKKIYGKKNISKEDLNIVRRIFTKTGALAHSNNMINEYSTRAKKLVSGLNIEPYYKEILTGFCDYSYNRQH